MRDATEQALNFLAGRPRPTVAWVGFASLFAGIGIDQLGLAGAQAGVPTSTMVALSGALDAAPPTSVPVLVFVPGHILGGILLGIALWRVIPKWAAVALILSQPAAPGVREHPPLVISVASLVLVVLAWRGARMALGWLVGLRVLSAVSAVPAFVVPDVPAWAQLFGAAFIVLTVLGCAMVLLGRPGKVPELACPVPSQN